MTVARYIRNLSFQSTSSRVCSPHHRARSCDKGNDRVSFLRQTDDLQGWTDVDLLRLHMDRQRPHKTAPSKARRSKIRSRSACENEVKPAQRSHQAYILAPGAPWRHEQSQNKKATKCARRLIRACTSAGKKPNRPETPQNGNEKALQNCDQTRGLPCAVQ